MTGPKLRDGSFYRIEGRDYPSVTAIIQAAVAKPQLPYWAARQVAEQAWHKRDLLQKLGFDDAVAMLKSAPWQTSTKAASKGSDVHFRFSQFLDGNEPEGDDVKLLARWIESWGLEPLFAELTVFKDDPCYAGTLDALLQFEGSTIVVDLKTGKAIYPEYALQVAAYANADFAIDEQAGKFSLPKADRGWIVHLNDSNLIVHEVALSDRLFGLWSEVATVGSRILSGDFKELCKMTTVLNPKEG